MAVQRQKDRWMVLLLLVGCCLTEGCAEERRSAQPPAEEKPTAPPYGHWLMYGGSETGIRNAEDFDREISILVLGDSTYSLTFMAPHLKVSFTESGTVKYDIKQQSARFTVLSASGVDWKESEPRKLVDVPVVVPFQREPGTVYTMEWHIGGGYMRLSAPGREDSYFKKLTPGTDATVDVGRAAKAQGGAKR